MRFRRLPLLGFLAVILAAVPALGATSRPNSVPNVQSVRGDFDRDGRADNATGLLMSPTAVRVLLSGTGATRIAQSGTVLAAAGLDYDRDDRDEMAIVLTGRSAAISEDIPERLRPGVVRLISIHVDTFRAPRAPPHLLLF